MAGYSDESVLMMRKELQAAREELENVEVWRERIRAIAKDHEGCECSCALAVLEVLKG